MKPILLILLILFFLYLIIHNYIGFREGYKYKGVGNDAYQAESFWLGHGPAWKGGRGPNGRAWNPIGIYKGFGSLNNCHQSCRDGGQDHRFEGDRVDGWGKAAKVRAGHGGRAGLKCRMAQLEGPHCKFFGLNCAELNQLQNQAGGLGLNKVVDVGCSNLPGNVWQAGGIDHSAINYYKKTLQAKWGKGEYERRRNADKAAQDSIDKKKRDEANAKREEEARRKAAEEAAKKKREEEARRKAAEEAERLRKEEEARKRAAEEAARKKREAEARRKAEEEAERKRKEAEAARLAAKKAKASEKARMEAEARRKEEELRQAEEEARRKAEDERRAMLDGRHKNLIGNQRSMLRRLRRHNTEHKKRRAMLKHKEKDIKPELMKRIKELEQNISKLQFQTKRTQLRGQNLVAVDKLDMGKLSMDLFNWQKINKRSPVDINLILGDHVKNAAKETTIKHVVPPKEEPKRCDPIPEISEKEVKQVEYKGYPVFKKPEFPQVPSEKYSLPKGAKAGPAVSMNSSISNINDNVPVSFNSWDYDQRADTGIEKTH